MKLDREEDKALIGTALTRKQGLDRAFVEKQVTRLIDALRSLIQLERQEKSDEAKEPETPIHITVPPVQVIQRDPPPRPRQYRFRIERDGAGRIKEVIATAED